MRRRGEAEERVGIRKDDSTRWRRGEAKGGRGGERACLRQVNDHARHLEHALAWEGRCARIRKGHSAGIAARRCRWRARVPRAAAVIVDGGVGAVEEVGGARVEDRGDGGEHAARALGEGGTRRVRGVGKKLQGGDVAKGGM